MHSKAKAILYEQRDAMSRHTVNQNSFSSLRGCAASCDQAVVLDYLFQVFHLQQGHGLSQLMYGCAGRLPTSSFHYSPQQLHCSTLLPTLTGLVWWSAASNVPDR